MHWKPDLGSSEPVFRQIMRYFEDRIIRGELSPGQSIPSERSLAKELNVNRSTVSMAYDELRSTGLIRSVRGKGTQVSEDLWGVIPSRIPNWNLYASKVAFLPALPRDLRIGEASNMPDIINLARSELSPDLFPISALQQLLRKTELTIPLGYSDPRGARQLRETLVKHLGYHVWCRTSLSTRDSEMLEMGIRNKILFVPGGLYGAERGYLKFSFARADTEEIEEGIRRFGETLRL